MHGFGRISALLATLILAGASLAPAWAYTLSGTVTDLNQKAIPFVRVVATSQVDVSASTGLPPGSWWDTNSWTNSTVEVKTEGTIASAWVDFSSTPEFWSQALPITLLLKAPDGTQIPAGDLSSFRGKSRKGTWTLVIGNSDFQRGGSCSWTLHLVSEVAETTNSEGKYAMMGVYPAVDGQGGLYKMKVSRSGFTFDPATTETTVTGNTTVDFTGDGGTPGEIISGTVSNAAGAKLKGVRVDANCTLSRSGDVSIAEGHWEAWAGIDFEIKTNMAVSSVSLPISVSGYDYFAPDISAWITAPDGTKVGWGDVRALVGKPAQGKWHVDFRNTSIFSGGNIHATLNVASTSVAYTNSDGNYILNNVYPPYNDEGGTYKVTATIVGYVFTPVSRDVTVNGSVSGVDFVGRGAPPNNGEELSGLGDMNGDGNVNLQDVALLLRTVLGTRTPEVGDVDAGDLTGDGALTLADVIQLLQRICFPAPGQGGTAA